LPEASAATFDLLSLGHLIVTIWPGIGRHFLDVVETMHGLFSACVETKNARMSGRTRQHSDNEQKFRMQHQYALSPQHESIEGIRKPLAAQNAPRDTR
jgi:hypothetical protein